VRKERDIIILDRLEEGEYWYISSKFVWSAAHLSISLFNINSTQKRI